MADRTETFKEFSVSIRKTRPISKIRNSWGAYDYFKYHKHNRPKDRSYYKITEGQFYKLLRAVNEYMLEVLIKEQHIDLPNRLGSFTVISYRPEVKIVDGKLKTSLPVDWMKTLRLWYEDREAEKKKILVRKEYDSMRVIRYQRCYSFKGAAYYEFCFHRKAKTTVLQGTEERNSSSEFFVNPTFDSLKTLYNG